MPKISALIHTLNDEHGLGRTLETLRPCDEVVVVDHGSQDKTLKVARQYGARIVKAVHGVDHGAYAVDCSQDWILCLLPSETLTEGLEASLFEWKGMKEETGEAYAFQLREEIAEDWKDCGPQLRLVNRRKMNWQGPTPPNSPDAKLLAGDLLKLRDVKDEGKQPV